MLRVGLHLHQQAASRMQVCVGKSCPYSNTVSASTWSADRMMHDIAIEIIYVWKRPPGTQPYSLSSVRSGGFVLGPKNPKGALVRRSGAAGRKSVDIDECPSDEQVETVCVEAGRVAVMLSGLMLSPQRWQLWMIKVTLAWCPKSLLTRSSPPSLQPCPSVSLFCVSLPLESRSTQWSRPGGEKQDFWSPPSK